LSFVFDVCLVFGHPASRDGYARAGGNEGQRRGRSFWDSLRSVARPRDSHGSNPTCSLNV